MKGVAAKNQPIRDLCGTTLGCTAMATVNVGRYGLATIDFRDVVNFGEEVGSAVVDVVVVVLVVVVVVVVEVVLLDMEVVLL
ncbi:unnamed protein product [Strongylus vulgaris]|uniref:Uncharacterized protein n=1 Tax=Strongylus vulgaris TaxID=40348 RepID=A0A3P7ILI3_STRVU|nr:unnamed protein product [Strongylus vulgaris]